ncbi:hypothetical protein D1007_37578 [Hordeum vulgare]|nr:hypothetical protein D1007_37578 [Hordeum vulgare]
MPTSVGIDLNAMSVGGESSSGGARKWAREVLVNAMGNTYNLFDKMRAREDEANHLFMESLIYEGGDGGIPFDPDQMQSQDGRTPSWAGTMAWGTRLMKTWAIPSWRTNSAWAALSR